MVRSAKHLVLGQLFVRNSLLEKDYFIMADLALKLLYLSILNYILIFNKEWKCNTYNMLFYVSL